MRNLLEVIVFLVCLAGGLNPAVRRRVSEKPSGLNSWHLCVSHKSLNAIAIAGGFDEALPLRHSP